MLSAIFDRDQVATLAWWLGVDVSYIEIDPKVNLTQEQIDRVEIICNEAIAAATPVTVHVLQDMYGKDVPAEVNDSKSLAFQNLMLQFFFSILDISSNKRFAKRSCW